MSETKMLKPRFFVNSQTPTSRRSVFVSKSLFLFLVILTVLVAPEELFAQNRVFRPNFASTGGIPAQVEKGVATKQTRSKSTGVPQNAQARRSNSVQENGVLSSVLKTPQEQEKDKAQAAKTYLEQTNGRYSFLRIAKRQEDFASLHVAPNAQIVVIPRKNFLDTEVEESDESEDETKEPDLVLAENSDEVQADESAREQVDDYVAFILTNLDSDEGVLLRDARDGRWDSTDLLSASLIAEGLTTPEKRAHYRSIYGKLLAILKPRVERVDEPFQKAEIVYNFLHSVALTSKYDLNCSSVAKALDNGVYNCVSATALFNCFAAAAGLDVAALETTGHAKSRVKFEDSYLDIETTCTDWNRLPDHVQPYARSRKAPDDLYDVAEGGVPSQLGSTQVVRGNVDDVELKGVSAQKSNAAEETQTGESGSTSFEIDAEAPLGYSFTRTKRPMREITEVELVATIYYNVGVDYYQSGAYEQAVAAYVKAIQLAPNNHTILGNLKATLNNWAIDLAAKEKKYSSAIQITLFGLALDPDFQEFRVNLPIFFRDWVEYLAKDNKWEEIKRVQEESERILAKYPE